MINASPRSVTVLVFERCDGRFALPTRHVAGVGESGAMVAAPLPRPPFVGVLTRDNAVALLVDVAEDWGESLREFTPVFAERQGCLFALVADRIVGVVDLDLDSVVHPALVAGREDVDLFHAVAMQSAGMTFLINLSALVARATLTTVSDTNP